MANYKINEKSKTISVSAELTKLEESIISTYIKNGYAVKEKRKSNAAAVSNEDILAYYEDKKDEAGKKAYEAVKEEKITDKNGKKRKGGFLVALKWFKKNNPEAYEAIKASKKT